MTMTDRKHTRKCAKPTCKETAISGFKECEEHAEFGNVYWCHKCGTSYDNNSIGYGGLCPPCTRIVAEFINKRDAEVKAEITMLNIKESLKSDKEPKKKAKGDVNGRSRRFVFTIWNKDWKQEFKLGDDNIKGYCYQHEIGEKSGNEHIQGYIEFTSKKSKNQVSKILGSKADKIWVNHCFGDHKANIDYTSKSKTAVPGTHVTTYS